MGSVAPGESNRLWAVVGLLAIVAVALFAYDPMERVSEPVDDQPIVGYLPVPSDDAEPNDDEVLDLRFERDGSDRSNEFDTRGLRIIVGDPSSG